MIFALVSSGPLAFGHFLADEARHARIGGCRNGFYCARSAFGRSLVEGGAAYGDDQFRIAAFDRGNSVAGIDRAGEGLLPLDRKNVGNLHHVEKRGDAGRDVLAGSGRRREKRVVMPHQFGHQRRDVFGQLMLECRIIGEIDFAHPVDPGGFVGHR